MVGRHLAGEICIMTIVPPPTDVRRLYKMAATSVRDLFLGVHVIETRRNFLFPRSGKVANKTFRGLNVYNLVLARFETKVLAHGCLPFVH